MVGGVPYLVGERGPELFRTRASGVIVPNHALRSGGTTINAPITVTVEGGSRGVAADRELADKIGSKVRNALRRGGRRVRPLGFPGLMGFCKF